MRFDRTLSSHFKFDRVLKKMSSGDSDNSSTNDPFLTGEDASPNPIVVVINEAAFPLVADEAPDAGQAKPTH